MLIVTKIDSNRFEVFILSNETLFSMGIISCDIACLDKEIHNQFDEPFKYFPNTNYSNDINKIVDGWQVHFEDGSLVSDLQPNEILSDNTYYHYLPPLKPFYVLPVFVNQIENPIYINEV